MLRPPRVGGEARVCAFRLGARLADRRDKRRCPKMQRRSTHPGDCPACRKLWRHPAARRTAFSTDYAAAPGQGPLARFEWEQGTCVQDATESTGQTARGAESGPLEAVWLIDMDVLTRTPRLVAGVRVVRHVVVWPRSTPRNRSTTGS